MTIVQFDYAVLISIIIGVTNIIPYFGPCIGAVPSVLILMMVDFIYGIIFAIFVLVLQQVDGNIIGQVILGDRLNLSSMWILFAILVGGGFFGVPGMILGAPCFACLYALVGTICRTLLKKKNMHIDAADYYEVDYIKPDSNIPVMIDHEPVKKGTAIFSFDKHKKEEAIKKRRESVLRQRAEEALYREKKKRNSDDSKTEESKKSSKPDDSNKGVKESDENVVIADDNAGKAGENKA
jgi:hypothetical protein